MICAFIAEHRARFGVAPICRVLTEHGVQIAPRTFYAWVHAGAVEAGVVGHHHHRGPGRLLRARRARPPHTGVAVRVAEDVGSPATSGHPGGPVHRGAADARATGGGGHAAQEGPHHDADPAAARAPDLVDRQFRVPAPNMLLVADFTYVRLGHRRVRLHRVRHRCLRRPDRGLGMLDQQADRVRESAIRQAAALRARPRPPIGGQHNSPHRCGVAIYLCAASGRHCSCQGCCRRSGRSGDAYDNALAETTIGLYKTEAVRDDSPFRTRPAAPARRRRTPHRRLGHWYNSTG